ncbi:MAG: glutathione S-transferase [Hyphomonadaceae bacterium]
MKLYVTDKAPNPDRVKYFLMEKGVWEQIDTVQVSITSKEHKSHEYRVMSPLAQVPVLQFDDGRTLTESRAICVYFEGAYPEPNLFGEDYEERAFIEMWDRRIELTYLLPLGHWFRNSHPAMAELETPQCPEWAEISAGRTRKMAAYLDERLGDTPYVAGDRFTIADITLHVAFGFGRAVRYKPWEEHANLNAWRERMLARPALAG